MILRQGCTDRHTHNFWCQRTTDDNVTEDVHGRRESSPIFAAVSCEWD